ncbi:hypothetical protein V5799_012599 [Amblyomma americanum]|uniref:CCHC-type domain-containing protein n=1 Tax=Amblyomma americanum TaxID=6943 RepID=A0AAQ4EE19_AMBAM
MSEETKVSSQPFLVQPPASVNFDKTSEWPGWIEEFGDYRFASGLNERTQEAQVRTLLYTMGRQARNIFKTFNLSEEDSKKYDVVKTQFHTHFVATRNLVYESACFHRRHQEPGESVDQYVTELHTLADRCDYGKMKERMILDRFVVGLRDAKLSEALQMDAALTLKSALTKARLKEAVQQQQQDLRSVVDREEHESLTTAEVDIVHRRTSNQRRPDHQTCAACGRGPHSRSSCPARGALCYVCQRRGHFAAVCSRTHRTTEPEAWPSEVGIRSPRGEQLNMNCVTFSVGDLAVSSAKARFVQIAINGAVVSAKVDTGADVNVVPGSFPALPKVLQPTDVILMGPGGDRLNLKGKFTADILWKRAAVRQDVFVVDSVSNVILGLPAIQALGIVKFVDEASVHQVVQTRFGSLFRGLGTMKGEYSIRLKPDAVPYAIHTAPRIPIPLRDGVKQELEEMEKNGVIRKVQGPTEWCAGIVPVLKPSRKVRICVDLTQLNKSVQRERFVLPTVDETLG